jgi:large subunit ribosomal protein L13
MGTYATKAKDVQRRWFLVDAGGQILGRMASEVACLLRGKWNPMYVPYLDVGDHVIVINASQVRFTGRKLQQKTYFHHTNHPGGARVQKLSHRMQSEPEEVVREAIWGMLPKGPLGRQMLRKLKVYTGPQHPHRAQQAIPYKLGGQGKTIPSLEATPEKAVGSVREAGAAKQKSAANR